MSRGFVKEDDQEEAPIIPPRAALPDGVTNYVTPTGMEQLLNERKSLELAMANLSVTEEQQRRRDLALLNGKLNLLQERIASARILELKSQASNEIRFGATVQLKMNNLLQTFQIVGVDEADVAQKKIAFVAPIARSITGGKVGDFIDFKLGDEIRKIEILQIDYH